MLFNSEMLQPEWMEILNLNYHYNYEKNIFPQIKEKFDGYSRLLRFLVLNQNNKSQNDWANIVISEKQEVLQYLKNHEQNFDLGILLAYPNSLLFDPKPYPTEILDFYESLKEES